MNRPDYPLRENTVASTPPQAHIPPHIAKAESAVQVAWVMSQIGASRPPAEVNDVAYNLHTATREDAERIPLLRQVYKCFPEPTYSGADMFAQFADDSEVVRDAITVVRCDRYEAALQRQAVELMREKAAVVEQAGRDRDAVMQEANADVLATIDAMQNDPRRLGQPLPELIRFDLDLTAAADVQRSIDAVADQLYAARLRQNAARDRIHATLRELADACGVLYRGPGALDHRDRPDLTEHQQAYETIARLLGPETARSYWELFETRWRDAKGWKAR